MNRFIAHMMFATVLMSGTLTLPIAAAEAEPPLHVAASRLLALLDEGQREKAAYAFGDEERENWHFFPKVRGGVRTGDLNTAQMLILSDLLQSTLSTEGFSKVSGIVTLEAVLQQIEIAHGNERARETRSPDNYYLAIFGEPGPDSTWGYRLEGHHASINVTLVDGEVVSSTPFFLGGNPHHVPEGPFEGYRPLADEEDVARELVNALNEDQRDRAIVSEQAPRDILTAADRVASIEGEPQGLPVGELKGKAAELYRELLNVYIDALHPIVAKARRSELDALSDEERDAIRFVWMGSLEPGEPHYYRIHARTFVIEYDNIQNNANHSHTVWRNFDGDFGRDMLAEHHKAAH